MSDTQFSEVLATRIFREPALPPKADIVSRPLGATTRHMRCSKELSYSITSSARLYRRYPRILTAITVVRPETVLRWHRKGFAAYWRWYR
jgi:hypothetical protein